ncbi:carboxymuconolactone decarboxylase family protein [Lactococcus lactis]|uniref:carboxymuconolactone decarboxylase family protein n=1 Tax=Lactococcus lactis TaxID=1358 RepID=UPI0024A9AB8B|nr:carboxymuconolactone decarboxylase family protein [Lactococcus lactis]
MNKYENGLKIRETVIGKNASQLLSESLKEIAPIIDEYTLRTFEEFYSREIFDVKQREIITISSLLTQGDTAQQLKIHIQAGLNVGLTSNEIVEVFVQCLPYVGFPKVLNAINVAKEVFKNNC